jgi:hypothetical protein
MRSANAKLGRLCLASSALGLLVAGSPASAAVFLGNRYTVGIWSGTVDTETYTGNGIDSKVWEYENVAFPNVNNTVIADTSRNPAWFVNKYVSTTPIGGLEFRYSDGYIQEDLGAPYDRASVEVSTNGTDWTEIWHMQGTSAWTEYFNTNSWISYDGLPAGTQEIFVRHAISGAYAGMWQMFGSAWGSGVKLHEGDVPEPTGAGLAGIATALLLGRRRQ